MRTSGPSRPIRGPRDVRGVVRALVQDDLVHPGARRHEVRVVDPARLGHVGERLPQLDLFVAPPRRRRDEPPEDEAEPGRAVGGEAAWAELGWAALVEEGAVGVSTYAHVATRPRAARRRAVRRPIERDPGDREIASSPNGRATSAPTGTGAAADENQAMRPSTTRDGTAAAADDGRTEVGVEHAGWKAKPAGLVSAHSTTRTPTGDRHVTGGPPRSTGLAPARCDRRTRAPPGRVGDDVGPVADDDTSLAPGTSGWSTLGVCEPVVVVSVGGPVRCGGGVTSARGGAAVPVCGGIGTRGGSGALGGEATGPDPPTGTRPRTHSRAPAAVTVFGSSHVVTRSP